MIEIEQTESTLELANRISPGMRVLIFLLGLVPLLAPYELLFKVRWQSIFNLIFLLALVIALGALVVSGFFMFFALAAYSRRMHFDRRIQKVVFGTSHVLKPYRERSFTFRDFSKVEIDVHDWSDGPISYSLQLHPVEGAPISIGYFQDQVQAERYLGLVQEWLSVKN